MENEKYEKSHWNLYYILQIDQRENPMPQHAVRRIQQNLAEFLGEKDSNTGCETLQ